ncbi:MAG: hypothetical protein LBT23_09645 [Synergistaceae bacterium]|nr:hypothetical protein [Synergistaceae bacterium]
MKKDYGPIPETREEAVQIAISIKEEDIDLSEMPETGGITKWRRGNNRVTYSKKRAMESAVRLKN